MAKLKETIIIEIKDYIDRCDKIYSNWYVGIAANPRKRLFEDHCVDEKNGNWIFREAENSEIAREIEEYFLRILKTDGGDGGGDRSTKYVYAYRKTATTDE